MAGITTLPEINAAIHDGWFDVDRIVHDTERAEVRLTIYPGRRTGRILKVERAPVDDDLPEPIGELIARAVVAVHIDDQAEVGWYPVDGLAFDQENSRLLLRSDIPLEITMQVGLLDIELAPAEPSV